MCVYCFCGDHPFKWDPPWKKDEGPWSPYIPQPVVPVSSPSWDLQRLKEYLDLLKQIKELEDKIGCPCEPNKADYLKLFELRIKQLELQAKTKGKGKTLLKKKAPPPRDPRRPYGRTKNPR